ncbi:MAG: hypothetical protein AABX52_02270, partial [Nanoarchaeota archaeon]
MSRHQIVEYVKAYYKQGYSASQIRLALRSGGIPDIEIDEALSTLTSQRTPSLFYLIVGISVLVVILATVYYFLIPASQSSLVLKLSSSTRLLDPGDSLVLIREISRIGSDSENVVISYDFARLADHYIFVSIKESVKVDQKNRGSVVLTIPFNVSKGQYIVLAVARTKSQVIKASFLVNVSGVVNTKVVNSCNCDDFNPCTSDRCVNGLCVYEKLKPCCGNSVCEEGEDGDLCELDCGQVQLSKGEQKVIIKDRAVILARRSVADAVALCKGLSRELDVSECLGVVAHVSKQSILCSQITTPKEHDTCLMDFVIDYNEFVLCEQVQDVWLRNSCVSYRL